MNREKWNVIKSFAIELALYGAAVTVYFFLVLHFLGGTLLNLYQEERQVYAFASLALIVGQGFVLEMLTRGLLRLARGKRKTE